MNVNIRVERVIGSAVLPQRAYEGDAGFDLTANEFIEIKPLERVVVRTGIKAEIPLGYVGMIMPRSGLAVRHGITVLNAPGIIDPTYRGEIRVVLYNSDAHTPFRVNVGNRIAQLVIVPLATATLTEVPWEKLAELPTVRGENGFGSSGI